MKQVFLISLFICTTNLIFAVQEITIVTHNVLPPYCFSDSNGELTGIYIEIVKKAISMIPGYSVSFEILPWARAKVKVKKGMAFAILPPYHHAHDWLTDEEPKRPYSVPLFTQHDVVIFNEKALTKPMNNYPVDLKGLTVAMLRGDGRAGVEFSKMVDLKEVKLHLLNDNKNIISFLLSGRADCAIMSSATFSWYVKQMKESGEYQKLNKGVVLKEGMVIGSNKGYLGYTDINDEKNYPYKKDFSVKFNIVINKMKRSGEIQQITESFIK